MKSIYPYTRSYRKEQKKQAEYSNIGNTTNIINSGFDTMPNLSFFRFIFFGIIALFVFIFFVLPSSY